MDCDTSNDLLLDHLYDELDEVRGAAMRKHLEACAPCREAYEKLSRGRHAAQSLRAVEAPMPSAALLDAIQSAAVSNARPRPVGGGDSVAPVVPIDSHPRFPRWVRRVGEFAMRRQVAMAAVFLLMIGFGLSYQQLSTPTRPLTTSDEPNAQVIPATELPSPEVSAARAAQGSVVNRRAAGITAATERSAERRLVAPTPLPAQAPAPAPMRVGNADPLAERQGAEAPALTPTPTNTAQAEEGRDNSLRAETERARTGDGRTAYGAVPPAAYRDQPTLQAATPGTVALNRRVTGDPAMDQALPPSPFEANTNAQQANRAQVWDRNTQGRAGYLGAQNQVAQQGLAANTAQAPVTWQSLRETAETHRRLNQTDQAIDAYRRALLSDPPTAERTQIARVLSDLLMQSGHVREASEVRAQYVVQAADTNGLANEVRTPTAAAPTTVSNAPTQRSLPSRAMPAHRRAAPRGTTADQTQNVAY